MHLPDHFYYVNKRETTSYTHKPQGTLDVSRLIKNKKPWKKASLGREQENKALIIADWTASGWSSDKTQAVKKILEQLIDEGVSIYIWQGNEVIPLENGSYLYKRITPAFNSDITRAAVVQHQLTQDQVCILDDYELQCLLNNEDQPKIRRLFIKDYITQNTKSLLSILKKATPRLEEIIHDEFSIKANEAVLELSKVFPEIGVKCEYSKLVLDEKMLTELWGETKAVTKNNVTLNQENLQKIENISLLGTIKLTDLQTLLSHVPALKILTLDGLSGDHTSSLNLKNLEELTLRISDLSLAILQPILSQAGKLKKLNLSYCKNLSGEIAAEYANLEELEELNLHDSNISLADIHGLITKKLKLKTLNLAGCQNLSGEIVENLNLPDLVALNLQSSQITLASLQRFIANSSKLETLDLFNCNLSGEMSENLNLPDLVALNLQSSQITLASLQRLIANSPKLKTLNLANCNLSGEMTENLNLPDLVALSLQRSQITLASLQHFIANSPKLKTLNLANCNLSGEMTKNLNLPDLVTLNLQSSQITLASLQCLIANSPKLETLNLANCDLSGEMTENLNLPDLVALNLQNSQISLASLQRLIANSPKLKTLNLINCKLSGEIAEELNLAGLVDLDLQNSRITLANLQSLIANSPKLKTLNLLNCKLSGAITREFNLKNLEELYLDKTGITVTGLEHMLVHASKLKKLSLRWFNRDQEEQTIEENTKFTKKIELPNLEELTLQNAIITAANLEHLLTNARSLEVLHLGGSDSLEGNLEQDLRLPNLKRLLLDNSDIIRSNLNRLTVNAKNLVYIDLYGCENEMVNKFLNSADRDLSSLEIRRSVEPSYHRPGDPQHDANRFRDHTPKKNHDFQFTGENKTWQQSMVIEKLSQYLTLKNEKEFIPKIQDGICFPLSRYFIDHSMENWTYSMKKINDWDGNKESLNRELESIFRHLFKNYVKKFQENQGDVTYLGDNLSFFLEKKKGPIMLSNPWHAVGLNYLKVEEKWVLYDPNFINGAKKLAPNELDKAIKECIGSVISVCGNCSSSVQPGINNPQKFIQDGGLLAYCRALNKKDMAHLLPDPKTLSVDDLDGLLLRNTRGIPAWISAIKANETIPAYALALLEQFILLQPNTSAKRLEKSIEVLTWEENQDCIKKLKHLNSDKKELIKKLCFVLSNSKPASANNQAQKTSTEIHETIKEPHQETSVNEKQWLQAVEKELQTWEKQNPYADTVLGYCQDLTQPGTLKKRLVELTGSADVQALQLSLQSHCQHISRPFFYVNSPEDLVCSAPFLERQVDQINHVVKGVLRKGPGGPLHDFLIKEQDKGNPPVLIVNYDNFDADDIVRFNGLLDMTRHADGTELPADALVIGLMNINKPDCYQGSDFYSRFDRIEHCSFDSQSLSNHLQKIVPPFLEKITDVDINRTFPINLYKAMDWEERLLGRWEIKQDNLYFVEGALQKALDSGFPLELQNPPLHDEKFITFWQQACLHGKIEHGGRTIHLPESFRFLTSEGYPWEELTACMTLDTSFIPEAEVLNSSRLSEFFKRYECDNETKTLNTINGLIEVSANRELHVNLTHALDEKEWAALLAACQEHQVRLIVHCAPTIILPDVLNEKLSSNRLTEALETTEKTRVLVSTDYDTTVDRLTKDDPSWNVIDVSECEGDDLLTHTNANFEPQTCQLAFQKTNCALLNALEKDEKVILKGRFSQELVDALAPLLLARHNKQNAPGQLLLISENNAFSYLKAEQYDITPDVKYESLKRLFLPSEIERLSQEELEREPLAKLRARLSYLQNNPDASSSEDAWKGLHGLAGGLKLEEFKADQSIAIAQAFNGQRLNAVTQVLNNSPYVFLTGLTAVGKSTFVEENFKNTETNVLYQGESQLLDWATDSSDKQKILFIDEANLSPRQWSEFEGLFNKSAGILIQGQYHRLSEHHKVIFAGNPINYGDERKLSPFFERHGNAVVFEPMPQEFIYEKILKPVFAETSLDTLALCQPLLKVYRFLCEHSEDKVLISPRELQMMALLVLAYHQENPTANNNLLAAEHYAYTLAQTLVPEKHQKAFNRECKPQAELERKKTALQHDDFLVTASREYIGQHLSDLLDLRQFRRLSASNDPQRYGGLGGIILDGEPGIGKSEFVVSTLRAHGYEEIHDYKGSANTDKDKPLYRMPVSMQTEEKTALLIKAFHEGAVVVIDEINSSPMMERLLNALLMGKTPEGERPQKPGFMVIGTQNPVTMAGRRAPSTALARRLTTLTLAPYTYEEMVKILILKGVDSDKAADLVKVYENQLKIAQQEYLTPAPTFRDLLKTAAKIINPDVNVLYKYIKQLSQEREKAPQKLAKKLSMIVKQFILARANKENPDRLDELKEEFTQTIKNEYNKINISPPSWKSLLDTIAIEGLLLQEKSILSLSLQDNSICQPSLNAYRFLLEHTENKALILPYALKMVVPLVLSWHQQNPEDNFSAAAEHYTYYLTKTAVASEHRAAFDAQFKPKTELGETSIGRVKTLYEHINELEAYGKKLSEETDDPRGKQESEKAQELAKKLANTATEFIAARADKENPDRLEKLRKEFAQTINEGYRELKMHRAFWKPLLTNIAIAATGIGLLLMIGKWLSTSKEQRTFGFFAETQGQKRIKAIEKAHQELDECNDPQNSGHTNRRS